jgi:uncharacterized protein DUF4349
MSWLERKRALLGIGAVGALVLSGTIVAIVSPSGRNTTQQTSIGRVKPAASPPETNAKAGQAGASSAGASSGGTSPAAADRAAGGGAAGGGAAGGGAASSAVSNASNASNAAATGAASAPAVISPPAAGPDVAPAPAPNLEPQVVRTGYLTLQVTKGGFQSAFDRASSIAQDLGGFVVSSSVGQPGPIPLGGATEGIDPTVTQPSDTRAPDAPAPTSGSLDLRVPGNRFNEARHALEGLATKVLTEQLSGNDASGQLIDLSARINNLEAEEASLRAIESRAGSISDVLQVQNQLTQVRSQIDELKAEQARLGNQVALASLHVQLQEPGVALSPVTPKLRSALARSWSRAVAGVEAVTGGMLVVLGYSLPVGVLGVLAWLIGGWALRRRRGLPAPAA